MQRHPLSFVIEGSDYLSEWFGGGIKSALRLRDIFPRRISFTVGDSGAEYRNRGSVELLTVGGLGERIAGFGMDYIGQNALF